MSGEGNCKECGAAFSFPDGRGVHNRRYCSDRCAYRAGHKRRYVKKGYRKTYVMRKSATEILRAEARARGETWYVGNPCKHGHDGKRSVSSGSCWTCLYLRNRARQQSDPEGTNAYHRAHYRKDPTYKKAKNAAYNKMNPQYRHKRRALGDMPRGVVERLMVKQSGLCSYCKCGIEQTFHVDHIVPVSRGGTNGEDNLQLTCPSCNLRKSWLSHAEFLGRMENAA